MLVGWLIGEKVMAIFRQNDIGLTVNLCKVESGYTVDFESLQGLLFWLDLPEALQLSHGILQTIAQVQPELLEGEVEE